MPRALFLPIPALFLIACTLATAEPAKTDSFSSGDAAVPLLELFSSQGCSSCPPAEHWFSGLRAREDLWTGFVPLVFHVDYWDYLGWKDPYASNEYSRRQRQYKARGLTRAVYTPGFFYAGREWRGWFQGNALPELERASPGNLTVSVEGNRVEATLAPAAGSEALNFHIALLGFDILTAVTAGENSGRKLPANFVVLAASSVTGTGGHWQLTLPNPQKPYKGELAVAAWISKPGNPQAIQATGGWLHPR